MLYLFKSVWFYVLIALLIVISPVVASDIVVNEILSSNNTGITDEDGEANDWIELYNNGSATVVLTNWGLSDNAKMPFKWTFPAIELKPGEFLLIWASDKNRTLPSTTLHTNFKISADGETIILTSAEGMTIDQVGSVSLPSDVSYGRSIDGGGKWMFSDQPTPGASNNSTFFDEVLAPVTISHSSGFYMESFFLQLSHSDPEAVIVYTLDGSEPALERVESPTVNRHSYLYEHKISITNRDSVPDVYSLFPTTKYLYTWMHEWKAPAVNSKKATIVRAKAFKPEAISTNITTATYFVDQHAETLYSGLPVISLVSDYQNLFDPQTGIYVPGVNATDATNQNFSLGWKRQSHISFFETNRTLAFQDNYEVENQGNTSPLLPQKGLHVIARSGLGEGMIHYPIFHTIKGRAADIQEYKRFIIRAWGSAACNSIYPIFSDAYHQTLVEERGLDIQAYRPCILFINGEYWGLHEVREANKNSWYYQSHYGVERDNPGYDLIDSSKPNKADEGDLEHWNRMIGFARENDMSIIENYAQIKEWVDVQNLIEYVVHATLSGKNDWPVHNESKWRPRTTNGKWRWTVYDVEMGLSSWGGDFDMIPYLIDENPLELFSLLLPSEEFKNSFLNTYADWLNTIFSTEREVELYNQFLEQLTPFMPEYMTRLNIGLLWEANQIEALRRIKNRVSFRRENLMKYFNLSAMQLSLQVSNSEMGYVKVNSIAINEETPGVPNPVYPWNGIYFQKVPIRLQAMPLPGFKFSHWEGTINSNSSEIYLNEVSDIQLKAHFVPTGQVQTLFYWMFDNNMPNNLPLVTLKSTYSIFKTPGNICFESAYGKQYPFHESHALWRKASMERRNTPTELNYHVEENRDSHYEKSNMRGLQIKQPFAYDGSENTLILNFSTKNYKNISVSFAAKDEGAAHGMYFSYYDMVSDSWLDVGIPKSAVSLTGSFQLFSVDLSLVEAANDNLDFKIRIQFFGNELAVDNGNRVSFNNFSVEGIRILPKEINDGSMIDKIITGYPNPARDFIYINSKSQKLDQKNFIILDLKGRTVLTGKYQDATVPINLQSLGRGIYFLKFEDSKVLKFTIE